jgi:NADPH:quinone reductase-like Zn-dependent oxidoreductase
VKAIVNPRYGSPDGLELRDVVKPELVPDGVLVRVRAAAVNPYDWHMMRGKPYFIRAISGLRGPKQAVIGVDFAGVVEAVGSERDDFAPGDEAFGACNGSLAEYVCARKTVVPKPANISFEQAAAVPVAGQTALQALRNHGHVGAGQRVLVNGAAGGVGTFAVQIAKGFGAHVTAVCSTRNVELVRSLGADEVVDYTHEDFARTGPYDLIVNNVEDASARQLRQALASHGTLVLVSGPIGAALAGPLVSRLSSTRTRTFITKPRQADLMTLKELIEAGKVTPVVDRTYPLEKAAEALRHLETRHARGKTVVAIA